MVAQRPAADATREAPEAFTLPTTASGYAGLSTSALAKKSDLADWFHVPSWKRSAPPARPGHAMEAARRLVFVDRCGLGEKLAKAMGLNGEEVVTVSIGERYERLAPDRYTIDPGRLEDYDALFGQLVEEGRAPSLILHLWSVAPGISSELTPGHLRRSLREGLDSLLFIAQTIENRNLTHLIELVVVSSNIHEVTGDEIVLPEKAPLLAACRVIPLEYANVTSRNVDIVMPPGGLPDERMVELLIREVGAGTSDAVVAYRGPHRWVQGVAPVRIEGAGELDGRLRRGGSYLITGGLGRIGLAVADYLASTVQARLVLVGRSSFPPPHEWDRWLTEHPEDDPLSRTIRSLRQMEKKGAELLVASADVADSDQMRRVLDLARSRFGDIHGVV
ncbi:MAG: KR domain-containing protein, partial [Bacteroidota bacterium]